MINSKMWLVVKPTVGLPVFFGGVVVAALAVHTAILINTTWFPAFLQGGARAARTSEVVVPSPAQVSVTADASRTAFLAQASTAQ
jgi:light-harvesting protein B-800-850 alpha chain